MRKTFLAMSLALGCFSLTSCLAGPHQLKRSVDDLDQKVYVQSPWLSAVLWVVPVFPLANFGAAIGDFFVGDAYAFWFKDAWDGEGTGFEHYDMPTPDGRMRSLLIDGASWVKIEGGMAGNMEGGN